MCFVFLYSYFVHLVLFFIYLLRHSSCVYLFIFSFLLNVLYFVFALPNEDKVWVRFECSHVRFKGLNLFSFHVFVDVLNVQF